MISSVAMIVVVGSVVLVGLLAAAYLFRHQVLSLLESTVVRLFHYYLYRDATRTWHNMSWLGVPTLKNPADVWIYQEIIHKTKPDLIVETGTKFGGSALYYANLFDLIGKGRVITVDIEHQPQGVPSHPRIQYLVQSSTDPSVIEKVRSSIQPGERVMVILDSDHSQQHVRRELELYAGFVTPGCYLVVEDTNVNGHPVRRSHGPGPTEALRDFFQTNHDFDIDKDCEKFKVTFFPDGWLRRRG